MNRFRRLIPVLPLIALLLTAPGCSRPGQDKSWDMGLRPIDQLTSNRTNDNERALRIGRDILRKEGLVEKYDLNSATAYQHGDEWEVSFTPKKGPFKRLRKRSFVFSL